jgi:cysteinyl-tRNA synthetase
MVVRLGDLVAAGMADPRAVLAPVVEQVLAARSEAREARDFAASDLLRDVLVNAGISVNDTPGGEEWDLPGNT